MQPINLLKIVDVFKPLFRLFNIDYPLMRKIVEIKLIMDHRRVPTILNDMSKKKEGNQFLKSLFFYAIFGIILVPFLFLEQYMFQMSIIFGMTMFILMSSMIADFSSVILDVRDKTILQTKPIDKRTINAAKFVHVTIYMFLITGAFILVPSLFIMGLYGIPFLLLFWIVIFLLSLLIITLTVLVYIFVLRFFDGERLKDIINYVQIGLSIGVIVGYQILARAFDTVNLDFSYLFHWWHIFIPPIWFASPFEWLFHKNNDMTIMLLTALAIIGPMISIIIYIRLMPSFERNLQKLLKETGKRKKKRWSMMKFWEKLICFSKEEKIFFRFSTGILGRERDFKLKVYPSLGLAFVFPLVFLYSSLEEGNFTELANSNSYLTIYFANIMIGSIVYMLQYSTSYKGSWIYFVTPIHNRNHIYRATLKAFIVKLYLPIFLSLAVIYLFIFSIRILPHLAIVFVSAMLFIVISYKLIVKEEYPFIKPFSNTNQGGTAVLQFLIMFIVGAFSVIHYLLTQTTELGIYLYLALLSAGTFITWKIVFRKKQNFVKR